MERSRTWHAVVLTGAVLATSAAGLPGPQPDRAAVRPDSGAAAAGGAVSGGAVPGGAVAGAAAAAPAPVTAGRSTTAGSPATTAVRLRRPADARAGDLLVAAFTTDRSPSVTAPTGWRRVLPAVTAEGTATLHVYSRTAPASGDAWTWRLGSAGKWDGGVTAYRGVDPAQPFGDVRSATKPESGNRITVRGVRPVAGGLLVTGVGINSARKRATPTGGLVQAWQATGAQTAASAYRRGVPGASTSATWRMEAGSQAAAWLGALRPAAPKAGRAVPVVAAAGDVACGDDTPAKARCEHRQVSDAILRDDVDAVLALGDLQYEDGTLAEFRREFHPTWGRLRDRIRPVVGNHEYRTRNAQGYRDYFGSAVGSRGLYYSFDLGAWHVVVLNSERDVAADGEQLRWLRRDLAAHRNRCVAAAWHRPRWSTGSHGDDDRTAPFYRALYDARAELVLSGHDHDYERFVPLDPARRRDDARGLVQVVSGLGGKERKAVRGRSTTAARTSAATGYLRMALHDGYADLSFRSAVGSYRDTARVTCR